VVLHLRYNKVVHLEFRVFLRWDQIATPVSTLDVYFFVREI